MKGVLLAALFLAFGVLVLAEQNELEERGLRDSIKQIAQKVAGVPSLGKLMRSVNMTEIARASTKVAKELSKSLKMDVFAAAKAFAAAGAAMGSIVFFGGMAGLLATGLGMFRYSPELYESSYFSNRIGSAYPNIPHLPDVQSILYQKVQQAQQQYLNSQSPGSAQRGSVSARPIGQQIGPQPNKEEYYGERNGQGQGRAEEDFKISARDARILKETKKPFSYELMPAIQDLLKAITNSVEKAAPGIAEALRR